MSFRKSVLAILLACCMPLAGAHEGHEGRGKAPDGKGKPAATRKEAPRFCMKNREGKVHCIPFGPH